MKTEYARVGDAHVAYRTLGEGPIDILMFLGEYIPVDSLDEEPRLARALRRLSSLGRVIAFNRRGVGLSDPPDGPLTMEQQVEDALAVLDHSGTAKAVVFGSNVAGPAAIQFAADHSDRTSALIIANTYARLVEAPDYPIGLPEALIATTADQTTMTDPGTEDGFDFLSAFAPSVANDERFRAWWDQAGHRGASPARSKELWRLLLTSDSRDALERITAPSLVMGRADIITNGGELTRYIADHIADARLVMFPGNDLIWWVGDSDAYLDEIEIFLGGAGSAVRPQRKLSTVLFFDVVGSTDAAARMGDRRWRDLLGTYIELARREVDRAGGQLVSTSGDGVLATFDMPADAVRSATRIAGGVGALGIAIRAGVHTGEIEILGDDVAGIGVHIAARVMAAAGPGEVLVSRTVCDLVTGSGLRFEDRGEHELKGVPGRWSLHVVTE